MSALELAGWLVSDLASAYLGAAGLSRTRVLGGMLQAYWRVVCAVLRVLERG